MKKFLLHLAVFLFVFCSGMIFVYSMSPGVTPQKAESKEVKTSGKKSSSLTAAETSAVKVLPPLVLPEGKTKKSKPQIKIRVGSKLIVGKNNI